MGSMIAIMLNFNAIAHADLTSAPPIYESVMESSENECIGQFIKNFASAAAAAQDDSSNSETPQMPELPLDSSTADQPTIKVRTVMRLPQQRRAVRRQADPLKVIASPYCNSVQVCNGQW